MTQPAEDRRTSGELGELTLVQLLAAIEASGKSARVLVTFHSSYGVAWFASGRLVDAQFEGLVGEPALLALAEFPEGRYELIHEAVERPTTIRKSVVQLFLPKAVRQSHGRTLTMPSAVVSSVPAPVERVRPASKAESATESGLARASEVSRPPSADAFDESALEHAPIPRAPRVPSIPLPRGEDDDHGADSASGRQRRRSGSYSARPNSVEIVAPSSRAPAPPSPRSAHLGLLTRRGDSLRTLDVAPLTGATSVEPELSGLQRRTVEAAHTSEPPAPHAPATVSTSDRPSSPPTDDARRVGRYEVVARLGRGGMGAVYLARGEASGGVRRLFALKVLRNKVGGASQPLMREAYVASRLHHPNVVGVLDAGVHRHQPYLVMEYVEGCSLQQLLARSLDRRPAPLIVAILMDALRGLHAAHALLTDDGEPAGVVHRDVSPDNLLVGIDGRCRVVDFGEAQIVGVEEEPDDSLVRRGKIGYAAPELFLGEPMTARSDIFSVGVVLYSALTGVRPFDGETARDVLDRQLHKAPAPPSTVGLRPPALLDSIILKALERDPERRWASADELRSALRRAARDAQWPLSADDVGDWVKLAVGPELAVRRRQAGGARPAQHSFLPPDHTHSDLAPPSQDVLALVSASVSAAPHLDEPAPESEHERTGRIEVRAPRSPIRDAAAVLSVLAAVGAVAMTAAFPQQVGRWFKVDFGLGPPPFAPAAAASLSASAAAPAPESAAPAPSVSGSAAVPSAARPPSKWLGFTPAHAASAGAKSAPSAAVGSATVPLPSVETPAASAPAPALSKAGP